MTRRTAGALGYVTARSAIRSTHRAITDAVRYVGRVPGAVAEVEIRIDPAVLERLRRARTENVLNRCMPTPKENE